MIKGKCNEILYLEKIENAPIADVDKERLIIVLSACSVICQYPVLQQTKMSVSDCHSIYIDEITDAKLSALATLIAGPVGAIVGVIQYRVAAGAAERRYDDCTTNAN